MIPNKIKIGPHTYKVVKGKGLGVDDNFGKHDGERLEIFIRSDVPKSQQEETFIHECLHAIRCLTKTELSDTDKEEVVVQVMGLLLYQMLRENKLLRG